MAEGAHTKKRPSDWTAEEKTDLVLAILAGELAPEEAAERHGLSVERVVGWRDLYVAAGRRHAAQAVAMERGGVRRHASWFARPAVRFALVVPALLAVVIAGAGAVRAATGNCPNDYTYCFAHTTPAKASDVNHNFDQVREWLEQKVGAVKTSAVTVTGPASFGQDVAMSGNVNFSASQRQMISLWGANAPYGIGVQTHTLYFRTDENFAWHHDGTHTNTEMGAGGGDTLMTLEPTALRARCPSGTGRLGAWCITTARRGTSQWPAAAADCADEGMSICPVGALMTCDQVNPPGFDCTTDTETGTTGIWTSSAFGDDVNVYQSILVYYGDGNNHSDELEIEPYSYYRYYYCCSNGPALAF